jgi:luciferase family oxidoreductase group 1
VPLYILGSSLFGAQLAAALGLPYAFASHFSPELLVAAVATYRREFTPSEQLAEPYVIAGVNVLAADTEEEAQAQLLTVRRARVGLLFRRGQGAGSFSDEEADAILASPQGRAVEQMMKYTASGTPSEVRAYLDEFAGHAKADELIVAHGAPTIEGRLRSVDLLADVSGLVPA